MGAPPYVSADEVGQLVSMGDTVEALRGAFRVRHDDPPRAIVELTVDPAQPRTMLSMPSRLDGVGGCKLISVFPENIAHGSPAIQGLYVLFSAIDGRVRALFDGAALTGLRTPAASALATDYLASHEVTSLGVFGTGVQAAAHVEAMLAVRPGITSVVVSSGSNDRAINLASQLAAAYGLDTSAGTARESASCDIICACTKATRALFDVGDIGPGTHINAVGAFRPDQLEIDASVVAGAAVFVDHLAAAQEEAGDLIQAASGDGWGWDQVAGDLVDLVNGRRPTSDSPTLFKSVGLSIEDLVVARLAADRAGIAQ